MIFASPGWLWLLLSVPLVYVVFMLDLKKRRVLLHAFAEVVVWKTIMPGYDPKARKRKAGLWLLAFMFAVLAMARPQWGEHEETLKTTGLDIMIALDVSNSMEVEDVVPSRLKKSKHLVRTMLDRLRGDRVGVVAFAASSYVACPLTTDLEYVYEVIDTLGPKSVSSQGTDIGIAIETAARSLVRGAEDTGEASRVIILISDGEDHEAQAVEGAKKLKEAGVKLFVLGVGTQKGGPIPVRDPNGQMHGYKRDREGGSVVSSFWPDALMKVAGAAGGKYWNVTPAEDELTELMGEMGALNRSEFAERKMVIREERFYIPLAVSVLLLLVEISIALRAVRSRGMAGLMMAVIVCAGGPVVAHAAQAPLDVYIENNKGLKEFSEGRIEEAKKHFGSAQAMAPEMDELEFNHGVVKYKGGDMEGAALSFDKAAKGASAKGDKALAGKSFYNLGGTLGQKGDFENALKSYLGALGMAREMKDVQLEKDTRKNIELLIRKQQEQQKQDKQDKQDKKDKKDKQDKQEQQKDEKDKKDEQEKKQEDKKENKEYQDHSKQRQREFKSQKMSKEDADRVMAELSAREKELQQKQKKQRAGARATDKDW